MYRNLGRLFIETTVLVLKCKKNKSTYSQLHAITNFPSSGEYVEVFMELLNMLLRFWFFFERE